MKGLFGYNIHLPVEEFILETFSLEEMKAMARQIFLKAVSAVDPAQKLKYTVRIEGNLLLIKSEEGSEKAFNLNGFRNIRKGSVREFRNHLLAAIPHKKVGHSKCACLPVGRECGVRS